MIPTPHINAKKEDFAKTVLMPGDPLRAKFIAETFLTDPVLVNNVRGVQGHTGTWKGVPVTVMASGMGIPSIGIYSWELFHFYDVDNIIRIGSAGALQDDLKLRDVVAGQGACTNSNYVKSFGLGDTATFAPIADFTLLSKAVEAAKEHGVEMRVGNLLASDTFYAAEGTGRNDAWKRMGVLAVEMESAALYAAHVVDEARLGQKGFGDELRAQRITGHQDGFCDIFDFGGVMGSRHGDSSFEMFLLRV